MKPLTAILLSLALASAAASAEERQTGGGVSEGMQCAAFTWAEVGGHQKAAILVQIVLDGRTYEFQLDTGADASFIPEDLAVEAGLMEPGAGGARVQDVRLGGAVLGPRWLMTRGSTGTIGPRHAGRICDGDRLSGAAPVPNSHGRSAVRHLPHDKLDGCRDAARQAVRPDRGRRARPGRLLLRHRSKPLSPERRSGRVELSDRRDAPMPSDRRIAGQAWGSDVELIGAPSKEPVAIASLPANTTEVFYNTARAERFARYPFPAGGLIGNAGVWDRTIVLWLGARPRFGIVEP